LRHDIGTYEAGKKPGDKEAALAFNAFLNDHIQNYAAKVIQRAYRQYKGLRNPLPSNLNDAPPRSFGIFHKETFVMTGSVPKLSCLAGRRNTQDALAEVIKPHGGAVSVMSSLDRKSKSTKKFSLLGNKLTSAKAVAASWDMSIAVREGYPCLSYNFIEDCLKAGKRLDSISSRFNVLNTPISTTAPIDAKTHVGPIGNRWHCTMIDQSAIAIGQYPGKNMRRFLIGCRLLGA
jgi:hypothetical protein